MTIVSDDPIWWPSIDSNFSFRCFVGKWKVKSKLSCQLIVVASQSHPLSLRYIIGVSNMVFLDEYGINANMVFSSINI